MPISDIIQTGRYNNCTYYLNFEYNMKKQELIQQILIFDNVGETENLDLKKMKKKELQLLYKSIMEYSYSRQLNWVKQFKKDENKKYTELK